jgi:hypothetical protein
MAEAISIPTGALAAAKSGATMPTGEAAPKTVTRKAEPAPKAVEKAPEPPKPVEEMTPQERKVWKLKADGEEFEFDATDEETVKREIMKARGADKRFKEAAAFRQQAETFFGMLKDPGQLEKLLTDPRIGVDVKKWAEEYVWKQIEESQLTPEQKAQRDKDRDYDRLKKQEDDEKLTKAEREKQQRQSGYESNYEKTILKALEIKGVPKDQGTVMKMADYMIAAVKKGYDLSPEEVADLVKQDNAAYFKTHTSEMNEDQFLEFLGEQAAEKLRKADLKRLKSPTGNPFPERYPKPEKKTAEPSKQQSSDWRKSTIDAFLARK